jgi:Sugar-specific transcriptional regulator TrmB
VGLTRYERKALMALMLCGVADAATLCREGSVPTSKIYLAMEKLAGLGLVQGQPTRPKMFAALPSEVVVARIVDIVREPSEHFAFQAPAAGSYRLSMATARRSSSRVPSRTAGPHAGWMRGATICESCRVQVRRATADPTARSPLCRPPLAAAENA